MWKRLHVKYLSFLLDFNQTWTFWTDFRKSLKYQISSKTVQLESSFSMLNRRTDMTKLIIAFRNFANTRNNRAISHAQNTTALQTNVFWTGTHTGFLSPSPSAHNRQGQHKTPQLSIYSCLSARYPRSQRRMRLWMHNQSETRRDE